MKNDTYTLFTIRFQKAEKAQPDAPTKDYFCKHVMAEVEGLTLKQAAIVAKAYYVYERNLTGPDGTPWDDTQIACIVRDGCTIPKIELVTRATFAHWEKHHHHMVQTGEIRR